MAIWTADGWLNWTADGYPGWSADGFLNSDTHDGFDVLPKKQEISNTQVIRESQLKPKKGRKQIAPPAVAQVVQEAEPIVVAVDWTEHDEAMVSRYLELEAKTIERLSHEATLLIAELEKRLKDAKQNSRAAQIDASSGAWLEEARRRWPARFRGS